MPPRPAPSRIAQALEYLQGLKGRAGEMLNTVASTPGTMRPDEYQERFGLPGDPVPAPREVGQTVREAVTRFTSLDAPQNPTFAEMAADTGASFVPGVGQLLAARDIERARRADDPAGMAMAASNFLPVDRLIGALRYGLRRPPIAELDVYHGTPHKYAPTEANPLGEFDASKIGTGEGAQAYGHGIYLAESPEVAEMYQRTTSKNAAMTSKPDTPEFLAEYAIKRWESPEKALKNLEMERNNFKTPLSNAERKQYDEALELLRRGEVTRGHRYKADLPDEMIDRMLDWDKPLSEQPDIYRKVLADKNWRKRLESRTDSQVGELTGAELYGMGHDQTKLLGIPGIKYLDEGSRGASGTGRWKIKPKEGAERIYDFKPNEDVLQLMGATAEPVGTRNFVVFPGEEKKVKILERK